MTGRSTTMFGSKGCVTMIFEILPTRPQQLMLWTLNDELASVAKLCPGAKLDGLKAREIGGEVAGRLTHGGVVAYIM